jgi:hypothetical protein
MAISFPISPSIGQIYTLPTGEAWEWNGSAWQTLGSPGVTGPAGPVGPTGPAGLSTSYYRYKAKTTTTIPPPGNTYVIWDNVTQISSTSVTLSHLTTDNVDVDIFLAAITVGSTLVIQDESNSNNYQKWTVSGSPILTPNTYVNIPMTYVTGGYSFSNDQPIIVAIQIIGPAGSSGTSGSSGSSGSPGTSGSAGTSGQNGSSGTSGSSGSTGTSGSSGSTGTSGSSGSAGTSGTSVGYVLVFGTAVNTTMTASATFQFGGFTSLAPTTTNVGSRRIAVPKTGTVKKISILTTVTTTSSSASPLPTFRLRNETTGINTTITTTNLYSGTTPFTRHDVYTISAPVTEGDEICIQVVMGNVTTAPNPVIQLFQVYIE